MREDTVLLEAPTFVIVITETYTTSVQYCAHYICLHLPYQKTKFGSNFLVVLRANLTPNSMAYNGPSFTGQG
jgi:hypothetical protein